MRYITSMRESPKAALLRVFGAAGLALGLLLGVAAPASAQAMCTTHAEVAKDLESRYSESPAAIGLASNGGVIELFAASDGATWTLVLTMPDGNSCAMAMGQGWENLPAIALGPQA